MIDIIRNKGSKEIARHHQIRLVVIVIELLSRAIIIRDKGKWTSESALNLMEYSIHFENIDYFNFSRFVYKFCYVPRYILYLDT
jgi:hypothetical protein